MINVLWIDDQPQGSLIDRAYDRYDIQIHNELNVEDGISELVSSRTIYDVIILDANCIRDSKGTQTPDMSALGYALSRMKEEHIYLPWVVYSAAGVEGSSAIDSYIRANQDLDAKIEWFKKPAQMGELLDKVRSLAEESKEYQIKNKYNYVFNWYPHSKDLIKIIHYIEDGELNNSSVFNDIRQELEWVMGYCIECGVLQGVDFIKTNLAQCSTQLGNAKLQDIIPLYIQRSFHSLTSICNKGSHRDKMNEMVKKGIAPFLVQSTVYELLNIIHWLGTLPTDTENRLLLKQQVAILVETNNSEETKSDGMENVEDSAKNEYEDKVFIVEQDDKGNYHCRECRISYKKAKSYLGKEVRLKNVKENNAKSKDNYPYFADFIPLL